MGFVKNVEGTSVFNIYLYDVFVKQYFYIV